MRKRCRGARETAQRSFVFRMARADTELSGRRGPHYHGEPAEIHWFHQMRIETRLPRLRLRKLRFGAIPLSEQFERRYP